MENFENWNKKKFDKNLNTNPNKNQRDYDKEPLILRDYSREMFIHNIFNLAFSLISLFTLPLDSYMEFGEIVRKFFIWFFYFYSNAINFLYNFYSLKRTLCNFIIYESSIL